MLEESHAYGAVDPESVQGRGFAELIGALEAGGGSASWARRLPEVLSMRGLAEVSAQAEVMIYRGGSPLAEFWRLSYQHSYGSVWQRTDAMLRRSTSFFLSLPIPGHGSKVR